MVTLLKDFALYELYSVHNKKIRQCHVKNMHVSTKNNLLY